jgi:hypothetical protein
VAKKNMTTELVRHYADNITQRIAALKDEIQGLTELRKRIVGKRLMTEPGAKPKKKTTHWTQRPENKGKMLKSIKRMQAAKQEA